jgi:hypothetical protein
VPLFVALWIKLALGYQLSIERDVCVVRKVRRRHFDLLWVEAKLVPDIRELAPCIA